MKKISLFIVATLAVFGISYTIGYYVGHKVVAVKNTDQTNSLQKPNISSQPTTSEATIGALKASLQLEKTKSEQLQQELKHQKQKVAQLEQLALESSASREESVIPASAYERTNFVMNLVHQFNADNASTEIIETDCSDGFCSLMANVSAVAATNPEIANLMRFLDKKKLPQHYQTVNLLNVMKKKDGSAKVTFSLNL